MMRGIFDTGLICMTPGIEAAFSGKVGPVLDLLRRHIAGDWGDLGTEDCHANNDALTAGDRLLSAYNVGSGLCVWIITEADRRSTTVLLPSEY